MIIKLFEATRNTDANKLKSTGHVIIFASLI